MRVSKPKDVGLRLANVRAHKGLSQKGLGEALDISWRTYQNYEVGHRDMSAEFLITFSEYFKINPHWIMFGEGRSNQVDELDELKAIIEMVEDAISDANSDISTELKADIICRLFRKALEGQNIIKSDARDFVEIVLLKGN